MLYVNDTHTQQHIEQFDTILYTILAEKKNKRRDLKMRSRKINGLAGQFLYVTKNQFRGN